MSAHYDPSADSFGSWQVAISALREKHIGSTGRNMIICGIDPGLTGAIFKLDLTTFTGEAIDMPVFSLRKNGKGKDEIDRIGLLEILSKDRIGCAFIEIQGTRKLPGGKHVNISAADTNMTNYGILLGIIAAAGIPEERIAPQKWKAVMKVSAAKDSSRMRASQLLPGCADQWKRVKDHGRAEAALIALYGAQYLNSISRGKPQAVWRDPQTMVREKPL